MANLTARDKAVLEAVFNPNLPLGDVDIELQDNEELTPDTLVNKQLEVEAIEAAEKGQLQQALNMLNRAMERQPRRPSLYNNRAHVYQYLRRFQDAFNDLTTAIELSNENHRKTLCQAYCQRGILHKRANRKELAKVDLEKANLLKVNWLN